MKAYPSIEELAEAVGISERTAWRWLRVGRIKKKLEDGQVVFILSDKSTDITDTELTTDTVSNVINDSQKMSVGDTKTPISDKNFVAHQE